MKVFGWHPIRITMVAGCSLPILREGLPNRWLENPKSSHWVRGLKPASAILWLAHSAVPPPPKKKYQNDHDLKPSYHIILCIFIYLLYYNHPNIFKAILIYICHIHHIILFLKILWCSIKLKPWGIFGVLPGPLAILYMSLRRVPSNSAIYDGSNCDPDVSWGSKHQQWWRMVILMVSLWDVSDFSWAFHKATWGLGFVETHGFKRLASLNWSLEPQWWITKKWGRSHLSGVIITSLNV